jgi:hypothetical protein
MYARILRNTIKYFSTYLLESNSISILSLLALHRENIKFVIVDNIHSVCENFIKGDGTVDYIERSNFLLKH